MRGVEIIQDETIEFEKSREVSGEGTSIIQKKFSTGAAQFMLGRVSSWMNRFHGPMEGAGKSNSGPKWYEVQTKAVLGLFWYVFAVMLVGISPFTAIPGQFIAMTIGVFLIGQSILFHGFTHMVKENGLKKATKKFLMLIPFMVPFYVSQMFTIEAGFLMGLAGVASYLATGRTIGRENKGIVHTADLYGNSHIIPGLVALSLAALGYDIWQNQTFFLSIFTIITFIFAVTVPIFMMPGNLPIHGVTVRRSAQIFKDNLTEAVKSFGDKNIPISKMVSRAVVYGLWFVGIGSIQIPGLIINAVKGKPEHPQLTLDEDSSDADAAMKAEKQPVVNRLSKGPGGIDLSRTVVKVESSGDMIQTGFDDPAMLRLLLNSDGLSPIIYNVKVMTPSMVNNFVGLN